LPTTALKTINRNW